MRKSTITKATMAAALGLVAIAFAAPRGGNHNLSNHPQQKGRRVDLVIALDTSGSMDGLIDSARQKLWDTVNLLATAQPQPIVRVGLISYGNDGYPRESGWVRKDADLTTDLDSIYSKLFALRTNGGTEYVSRAVRTAVNDMQWDKSEGTLKLVFVAGNEPANQDPQYSVDSVMADARERGIHVNSIYCGNDSAAESAGWRMVASIGGGRYAAINQNAIAVIATPMDGDLATLSQQLNKTYVAYGAEGGVHAAMQAAQDDNAKHMSSAAAASRAQAKSGALYDNSMWDLIDARRRGKDVSGMKAEELPAPMRTMSPAERNAYLDGVAKQRQELQAKIADVSAKREAWLKNERAKSKKGDKGFDDAFNTAVQSEAEASGFSFAH